MGWRAAVFRRRFLYISAGARTFETGAWATCCGPEVGEGCEGLGWGGRTTDTSCSGSSVDAAFPVQ
ncbi:hypothetical protein I7I53_10921 [Histoplasma capsulatum var. duboisii H88]|uniref:Uncharacterized protein n=1 Tax=Ajellomyces capsulatus (strain H88) TaxID=544711 RepID=A0A8A1LBS1_AJEC8|nr:hypothetical protein I7I53_10921 [Histoplasma capsulatum var. duboisii H88]